MQSVFNTVKGTALGVAEYLTPVLKVHDGNEQEKNVLKFNLHFAKEQPMRRLNNQSSSIIIIF